MSQILVDLSQLPAPTIVEQLDFEAIFAEMLADLQERDETFDALVESVGFQAFVGPAPGGRPDLVLRLKIDALGVQAAVIDPRIDVALVSGYFDNRDGIWSEPIYRNVFGLLREFGDAEIASLIAPRALIVEHSDAPAIDGPPKVQAGRSGAASGSSVSVAHGWASAGAGLGASVYASLHTTTW